MVVRVELYSLLIRVWFELEGRFSYYVKIFYMIVLVRVYKMVGMLM